MESRMTAPLRLPAYQNGSVKVYLGDAREVLRELSPESVDCVVTSPPYWGLRDFDVPSSVWGGDPDCRHRWGRMQRGRRKDMLPTETTKRRARVGLTEHQDAAATSGGRFCERCGAWLGSLGLESSPELFVVHMVEVMREVRRVLKPTGTLWLNLGDSFYGGSRTPRTKQGGLKPKDLIGIPWEVALAMREDGWYLRSDLVWSKPNPVPEPSVDRPIRAHEFVFLLSKERHYFYDAEAVREVATAGRGSSRGAEAPRHQTRNRRSVWTIPTQPYRGSHTATFPVKLVEPCILAGTSAAGCCSRCGRPWRRELEVTYQSIPRNPENRRRRHADPRIFEITVPRVRQARTIGWQPTCDCDAPAVPAVVLDPFVGTGTTLLVAQQHGRQALGVELNRTFLTLMSEKLSESAHPEPGGSDPDSQAA